MYRSRYQRIVLFFARTFLSLSFWDILLPRLGLRNYTKSSRPERLRRHAAAFRELAVKLGGVMIKVGQFLSSRVDILPPEITKELEGLQDEVPAERFEDICKVAEEEYNAPLSEKFAWFEEQPLAAASLGQVHRARLFLTKQGEDAEHISEVVVKIQRPHIETIIATDLAALRTVGRWLQGLQSVRKHADILALLSEFTRILYEEINYLAEGRNAETFAANFRGVSGVRVPRVIWTHTTRRVLTLENVLAIKITDYQAISQAGVDRAEVAARLLDTYLKQIFEDGFFHADPHPGNLFVNPIVAPAEETKYIPWELTFVDFGMAGQVPANLYHGLRELLIGIGTQDAHRVIKAYQMMDVLLPNADITALEAATSKVFQRYWGKNMSELTNISFYEIAEFADEFRELIYEMPFQMPQNLIFLARVVGILAGMCTGLDPHFNLWDHLAPFARKLIAEESRFNLEKWVPELESYARTLLLIPKKLEVALSKVERGEVGVRAPLVEERASGLESAIRQATAGIIFSALLISTVQLFLGGHLALAGIALFGTGLALIGVISNFRKKK